jgi:hypothetical protein
MRMVGIRHAPGTPLPAKLPERAAQRKPNVFMDQEKLS